MVSRTYSCDICRGNSDANLIGLKFGYDSARAGEGIQRVRKDETERHICQNCLCALMKIGRDMSLKPG